MNVTPLSQEGLNHYFRVTVDANTIAQQTEAELKTAGERVKIPGFRPGHIPMNVLKQRFGESVKNDVLRKLIEQAARTVMHEKKLRPVKTPQVDVESYEEGSELKLKIGIESFPEVPALKFDHITLTRQTFEVEDAQIEEALERLSKNSPKLVKLEGGTKAKEGHVVTIDFKGTLDGKAFAGGSADNVKLELGSNQFIPGFEDQLADCKAGDDKIVSVTFPENYGAKDLAGKAAQFSVKVHEVSELVHPEINEEFAKERGFADLRALREAVRDQLVKEYNQVVRGKLKKELFDILEDEQHFPVPTSLVDSEFENIWQKIEQAKKEGDDDLKDKSEAELRTEYKKIAERRVRLGILLAEIGNRQKLEATREELTRAVMQQASMFPGQEKKIFDFYREHPERVDDLRGPILEEKSVDYILDQVKYTDTKVTIEELIGESESDAATAPKAKKKAAKPEKSDEEKPKKRAAKKKE